MDNINNNSLKNVLMIIETSDLTVALTTVSTMIMEYEKLSGSNF